MAAMSGFAMAVNAAKEDQLGAPPTLKRKRAAYGALRPYRYVGGDGGSRLKQQVVFITHRSPGGPREGRCLMFDVVSYGTAKYPVCIGPPTFPNPGS